MKKILITKILLVLLILQSCSKEKNNISKTNNVIFNEINHATSGIDFSNILTENDTLNYFTYSYLYMGGGVSAGDINNDGLVDLYFTGNQVPNKLYLNKGNLQFEDISEKAGVSGDKRWYTGVTMADINGDGFLDIYCSVGGKYSPKNNQLFLNNGDNTFTEKAEEYGINDIGNSVQATFLDYDKDGDLDLFVANYPPTKFNSPSFYYVYKSNNIKDEETDHLYKNDGEKFIDVTNEAGVKSFGLSLSATVGDLNNDSWPDIYISNDFMTSDYMYINNQDGTFREVIKDATAHTAFYGMGVDISDYNNDGNLDIFQVDMDAKSNRRKKANMASMNPKLFWETVNSGFHYQYMQNCLQLNSGVFINDNPYYTNLSRISGMSSTDWSWGPLFADFDNDGLKDLFVSNGTRKEINNNDYFNNLKNLNSKKDSLLQMSQKIPSEKIDNFIFKNNGNHNFSEANDYWGIKYKGFSNGVVYADFDNDGDLEIVTNNIDDYASFFENTSSTKNNYLKLRFKGDNKNTFGLGVRAYIQTDSVKQMQELTLTRGFQSSVAPELHFGIGNNEIIKEIKVIWNDGKIEKLNNVNANQVLTLKHLNATNPENLPEQKQKKLFTTISDSTFLKHKHIENEYNDFKNEVLLPHRTSTFGPDLSVGDLNGDGKEDFFIGGATKSKAGVYFQTENGNFHQEFIPAIEKDSLYEDIGSLIFDADNDGDNDLYVVSGGNEFAPDSEMLQDRLYINDGNGNFTKDLDALPKMLTSGSRVYKVDFDKDGKDDLLVLGRLIPRNYPKPAKSYILKNISENGQAKFSDITDKIAPDFISLGLATSAQITDINNDGWQDIIVVGEWMPIRIFENTKTSFKEVSKKILDPNIDTTGWWWSINEGDFDKDGDMDYIVGNLGLNYKYKANKDETFDIYVNDFDKDNKSDIVLSYYNEGEKFPVRGRECSSQQIPGIKNKFPNYESFSTATLEDVYAKEDLENGLHYQVKSFASIYLKNVHGKFEIHELPIEAQFSCINQILIDDFDNDGNLDAVIAGNLHWSEIETPRNDAGMGLFLKGNGKSDFMAVKAAKSGLFIPGDVKDLKSIKVNNKKIILTAKNDGYMQFINN